MSDFDKEAEREKLREKYERDKEKRETTEKMSELLLQGATMTNAHCSDCSDPIFRYDGQEFCATCQRPVERDRDEAETEDGKSAGSVEVTKPRDDVRVQFGGQNAEDAAEPPADSEQEAGDGPHETAGAEQGPNPAETAAGNRDTDESHRTRSQDGRRLGGSSPERVPSLDPARDEDVQTARAALVRTLVRFSRNAEAASDPQQATEHLTAAREAAETLAALRQ